MRLSLKDYVFSHGLSGGIITKSYANGRYNNRFLSTNYFKSQVFLDKKNKKIWDFNIKEYYEKSAKNVIVKVDSNYLISQKNEDGIITLEFENVNEQGHRINTYKIEIIFNIVEKDNKAYIASLEWVNITSSNPNPQIKYEVTTRGLNTNGSDTLSNLTEFTLNEEVAYTTDEEYKKYPVAFEYNDAHYNKNKEKISFENIIFAYRTTPTNTRLYNINDTTPVLIVKAIGALASDVTKIYVKDITDFKRYYRQGCLYSDNSFKGVNKISKKLYLGTKEILEDEISNSEKVDTGHVRLFKDTVFKQAKYVESDN